jgi:methylmalonyl-CoA/ethylmalonyl-CoA epimerase
MPLTDASLHHAAFITRDLEATARSLADSLGVSFGLWTIACDPASVRGEPRPFSFRLGLTQVGPASIELIQPLEGRTVYDEHLEAVGEGFHHTCVTYPTRDAFEDARRTLASRGLEIIQQGKVGDAAEFCYFDLPALNSAFEILHIGDLPEPEGVIG